MSEKLKILDMLRQGTITVDEASQLLAAAEDTALQTIANEAEASSSSFPDLSRFRRLSYIPFGVSLLLLLLIGWGTFALSRRVDGRVTAGVVIMLILLVLMLLATLLTFAMTQVPWLHVRVQSRAGGASEGKPFRRKFAISLPVPLTLAQWGLRIAGRYVDEDQASQLQGAAALVKSVKHDLGKPETDPIVVDVDDEDERVQIYIG